MRWTRIVESMGKLLATTFGTGFSPVAPGTVGSLVALAIYHLCFGNGHDGGILRWLALLVIVPLAMAGCAAGRAAWGKDPGRVNVDEFAGAWVAFCMTRPSWGLAGLGAAFLLFRLLDILKPWPVNRLDRLNTSLGILLDDVAAGLMTGLGMLTAGVLHELAF